MLQRRGLFKFNVQKNPCFHYFLFEYNFVSFQITRAWMSNDVKVCKIFEFSNSWGLILIGSKNNIIIIFFFQGISRSASRRSWILPGALEFLNSKMHFENTCVRWERLDHDDMNLLTLDLDVHTMCKISI